MKVAILGAGLIGGSIGLAIGRRRPEITVTCFDADDSRSARAVERGAASASAPTVEEAVEDAAVVFVAVPVGAVAGVVLEAGRSCPDGCVLTDVGSTKAEVVREVEARGLDHGAFVPGHPIAGSEQHGIDAARADLFEGAWWVLVPRPGTEEATRVVGDLVTTLGARVVEMEARSHDLLMAVVSHLPQLASSGLMAVAAATGLDLRISGGGFRDMTRLAMSDPRMWSEIVLANAGPIGDALAELRGWLEEAEAQVRQGKATGLEERLRVAREARAGLPLKAEVARWREIEVAVADRPGVLADLTAAAAALGINLEDLRISHAQGARGVVFLAVGSPLDAERLSAELRRRGYEAAAVDGL